MMMVAQPVAEAVVEPRTKQRAKRAAVLMCKDGDGASCSGVCVAGVYIHYPQYFCMCWRGINSSSYIVSCVLQGYIFFTL